MSFARTAYSALVFLLTPAALLRLWWRGRRQREYRQHIGERFGRYVRVDDPRPVIWLHAVSVGETHAAEPLVRTLLARYPQHQILLTHTTPTGRRASETLVGDRARRAYLPYDSRGAVARFLEHFRPRVAILMETEVWPNLIEGCRERSIPIYLVNARLSEKSFRGYRRLSALLRDAFGALTAIGAQTPADAHRFNALGAREVHVVGNIKFDVVPSQSLVDLGHTWRKACHDRGVLLAASTRQGEEALLIDLIGRLPGDVLFVIVPRHPHRFAEVAALLEEQSIPFSRRSSDDTRGNIRVLLGDTMGEMPAYYAMCDLAFIGGSLLPYGGQNLIEACAVGRAVLLGPHTYNFAQAAEHAIAAGAALRVQTPEELMATAARLLNDRRTLAAMSACAVDFSRSHRGATERILRIVEGALEK